ncbi:kinase-like protein [Fomitiporia mediterranea MF3/22]|uniref:kinase-like protein n=1 Tax=Fomitiporia mediterranea (strain MF3/22) TaxID=694068 RepID=UPI0004407B92|nr:kinase-like protein [Fomitiporia mediterranea MF3/22]EJD04608.1 kinase-like protein [Fomitiporia mediterranea MF3/22]
MISKANPSAPRTLMQLRKRKQAALATTWIMLLDWSGVVTELSMLVFHKVQRTHRGTGAIEDVAVKAVRIDAQSKKPQPDPREIRALLFIKDHPHENIIRYFEKFDSSNEHKFGGVPHTCFVFELFRRDLHDEIKLISPEKLWPEQRIASIAAQILKGLEFLHENNYVHRDIKPDNIMVDDTYNIKITDFGLTAEMPNEKTIMDMEGYCSDVWATGQKTLGSLPSPSQPLRTSKTKT